MNGRFRTWSGACLLALAGLSAILLAASGRWVFTLRTPGDRARLELNRGMATLSALNDPTASFMFPPSVIAGRDGPWQLQLLLDPPTPNVNAARIPGGGWGVHVLPGVAWFLDAGVIREACCIAWPFPILLAVPGAVLWRSGRRASRHRVGRCTRCGYDLTALPPAAPCPECGGNPP